MRRTGRWDVDPFDGLSKRTATKDKHRIYKRPLYWSAVFPLGMYAVCTALGG